MISQKMIDWGSQGCGIREIAAYGEARAAVVGAENVFNFTIGNPSVKAPDCVARSIRHLLDTVPPEVLPPRLARETWDRSTYSLSLVEVRPYLA